MRIPDPTPQVTKRHRLYAALAAQQNSNGCADNILRFVTHAMNPVRHVGNRDYFESERGKLNGVLAFRELSQVEINKARGCAVAFQTNDLFVQLLPSYSSTVDRTKREVNCP